MAMILLPVPVSATHITGSMFQNHPILTGIYIGLNVLVMIGCCVIFYKCVKLGWELHKEDKESRRWYEEYKIKEAQRVEEFERSKAAAREEAERQRQLDADCSGCHSCPSKCCGCGCEEEDELK